MVEKVNSASQLMKLALKQKAQIGFGVIFLTACLSAYANEFQVTANTYLPPSGNISYTATNLTDGKTETAWCAKDASGKLVVEISYEHPTKMNGIGIFNGYQKNRQSYLSNSRPEAISIQFDGRASKTYELADQENVQWIPFEAAIVKQLRIEIGKNYRGSRYADVCMSEIIFDRQIYEAYVLMQQLVVKGAGVAALKPVFDIYDTNRRDFTKALTLIRGQRSTASLKFILDLNYFAEKRRGTIDAELLEGLRDIIIPYIEKSPEVVLDVLKNEKQVALERIDSAYVQYIDSFDEEGLTQHRKENVSFAKLMDVIEERLSK